MINWTNSKYGKIMRFSPKRYCIDMSGRGGSRSHTGSTCAVSWLLSPNQERIFVTRQNENQLATSIVRECLDRIGELETDLRRLNFYDQIKINQNLITYKNSFISGFGFQTNTKKNQNKGKSLASASKIIMEECNDNEYEDFQKIDDSVRTDGAKIVMLCNPPPKNHWINRIFFDLEPVETPHSKNTFYKPILKKAWEKDVDFIYRNYLDNPKLLPSIVEKYTNYGNPEHPSFDPDYYYNQILGYVPAVKQGLIFSNWTKLDHEPNWNEYKLCYGLDFGYNDPTAFVLVGHKETELGIEIIIKEVFYQTKLTADEVVEKVKATKKFDCPIVADCSRPEIIKSLNQAGIETRASKKGDGSILEGINYLLKSKIKVIGNNLTYELDNHSWQSKEDALKDKPEDTNNHGIDATRYALEILSRQEVSMIRNLEFKLKAGIIDSNEFENRKKAYGL